MTGGERMPEKLLIADDDGDIVAMLKEYFELTGYFVMTAAGGREAVEKAAQQPDLILLDVNMPDEDGFNVCRRIRGFVSCPIIFLTARIEDGDKIEGFGVGADDYVQKPFSLDALGARVMAHLRREKRRTEAPKVRFDGGLSIDYSGRELYYEDKTVGLAPKEFDIVALLSRYPGQSFDRERIYDRVWSYDGTGDSTVIAEHIRRIRTKLEKAGAPQVIETVWGVGYKWKK